MVNAVVAKRYIVLTCVFGAALLLATTLSYSKKSSTNVNLATEYKNFYDWEGAEDSGEDDSHKHSLKIKQDQQVKKLLPFQDSNDLGDKAGDKNAKSSRKTNEKHVGSTVTNQGATSSENTKDLKTSEVPNLPKSKPLRAGESNGDSNFSQPQSGKIAIHTNSSRPKQNTKTDRQTDGHENQIESKKPTTTLPQGTGDSTENEDSNNNDPFNDENTQLIRDDPLLQKAKNFNIEKITPFYENTTWRCNSDKTCYENWLAMKFPPDGEWDKNYSTPCYTDRKTGRFRCIPHIYMVGWAKSGTTEMWMYWQIHPDLIRGYKETQFLTQFSFWEDHKTMKKFDTVLRWFDQRSVEQKKYPKKLMFDMTATVIYDNWHWRIKQGYQGDPHLPTHTNFHYLRHLHPNAKIVAMMRNPVTRALSFYNHGIDMTLKDNANLCFKYKNVPKTAEDIHTFFVDSIYYFNKCVNESSLRACCHMSGWLSQDWGDPKVFMTLRIGIYYVFLEEIFKNFPQSQVHLIKYEDFRSNTVDTLNDVFSFLSISTQHTSKLILERSKSSFSMTIKKYFKPLPKTYKLLKDFYEPYNRRLLYMLEDTRWKAWEEELETFISP